MLDRLPDNLVDLPSGLEISSLIGYKTLVSNGSTSVSNLLGYKFSLKLSPDEVISFVKAALDRANIQYSYINIDSTNCETIGDALIGLHPIKKSL